MTNSSAAARFLSKVNANALCSGCGACAALAPDSVRMEVTPSGFSRPRQFSDITTEADAAIARICPGLVQNVTRSGRRDDPIWGPYVSAYAGWAQNKVLRFSGASGGALSGVLSSLLVTKKVDGVIQIAADPDNPVGNITVISRTPEDIQTAAGSRYAPSSPLAILLELPKDERFAFVGKPCDIAALQEMRAADPTLSAQIPLTVSFFCAGVPSLQAGEAVVAALGAQMRNVDAFRYRGMGWPGRATATLKDGSTPSMSYHESWGGILSAHVQHRCKICADGTGKAADIVCADAWDTDEKGYPLFEEADGVSLIMGRTALGEDILAAAKDAGHITFEPFDMKKLAAMQPGQFGRRRVLLYRLAGLALTGRRIPKYRGLNLLASARHASILTGLKNLLGMMRRSLTGRVRD